MAFYGCPSKFTEKHVPTSNLANVAIVKGFRRMLFQDFQFLEAARMRSGLYEGAYLNVEDFCTSNSFKSLVVENPHGVVNFSAYTNRAVVKGDLDESSSEDEEIQAILEEKDAKNHSEQDVRTKRFLSRMSVWPPLNIWSRWILRSCPFEFIMICVILLSSMLMCLEGETENLNLHAISMFLEVGDYLLLLMFVMEITLKWLDDFREFWNDYWNWFDLIVTSASVFTPLFDIAFPVMKMSHEDPDLAWLVNIIKYIRIARILRTLNVVTRLHKIMVIWGAITRTFGPLVFIIILMLLFFYIFAIIGIQIADRFTYTHKTNLHYVDRFTHLPYACLTLFQIFTIDHWFPMLKELMEVVEVQIACIYILSWLLLGTFIFKNIFAGVMVNNFQNIRQELFDETSEITNKARLASELMEVDTLEEEIRLNQLNKKDWEAQVFHILDLIKVSRGNLSPCLWPRDTLFHFYIILEALGNNISERDQLLNILNEELLQHYTP